MRRILLTFKSLKYSQVLDFDDAVSTELMRVQLKLDRLLNSIYPCFPKAKEMDIDPIKHERFQEFVKYWQAYSNYPGIASCSWLSEPDGLEKYTLTVKSGEQELDINHIYLRNINGKIAYSMITHFKSPVHDVLTDIKSPIEFTKESINELKLDILLAADKNRHLQYPMIILLKQTDGSNYYDPLSESYHLDFNSTKSITSQDLVSLNSSAPIAFKAQKIRKGAKLKAYVYDFEKFGFLRPHQSEIRVISVEDESWDEFGHSFTCNIEIQHRFDESFIMLHGKKIGEPMIKKLFILEN